MQVFVHSAANENPELVEVVETATVRELILVEAPDHQVWLEEVDEELELDATFERAGVRHRAHVHRGHCSRVTVRVRGNDSYERTFGPATTIRTVEHWAFGKQAAGLSPEQAAAHVLAVPGADHFLAGSVHIGSLVGPGTCSVTLDLFPRVRFEG